MIEPVVKEARRLIMRDVLRWALPVSALMSVVALTTAVTTGMFKGLWSRGVPSIVLLFFTALSFIELKREHLTRAVWLLIAGIAAVIVIALTFNGGVRAPAAMLLFFLVSLCGWVFGRVGATVMAVISVVVLSVTFVLGTLSVLPEPPGLPLVAEFVMLLVLTLLSWTTSSFPPDRMRTALLSALVRERELEAEQRRSLEAAHQFQSVFDQTPHLLALVSPGGNLLSINRAALEFVGLESAAPLIGVHFSKSPWWSKDDSALLREHLPRALAGEVIRFDTRRVDSRGRVRELDFSISPFKDPSGALKFLIAEARDVTELRLAQARREVAARLELVGQVAAGVAHDFNNVLTVIMSSGELLRRDLEAGGMLSEDRRENLDTITDASRRANDLTRRLLSFGRRSSIDRRPVPMRALITQTMKLLERTLPENVKVIAQLDAGPDVITGDPASLESVLINLALNARDAMPPGGTLTFTTEPVQLDETWCRASGFDLEPGAYLRVSVRDTGVGIAPENLERVFEPFFSTKPEGKGSGLGLASVFSVVREHQGAVHVSSELGQGTVFALTLPLAVRLDTQP